VTQQQKDGIGLYFPKIVVLLCYSGLPVLDTSEMMIRLAVPEWLLLMLLAKQQSEY
jgi:hypothetical protein